MLANSRLSTSANCELISSWAESRAASTTSPAAWARSSFNRLKSPASAVRSASRRMIRICRMLRIASLRAIFHSPSLSDRAAVELWVFPPRIAASECPEKPCVGRTKTTCFNRLRRRLPQPNYSTYQAGEGSQFFPNFRPAPPVKGEALFCPTPESQALSFLWPDIPTPIRACGRRTLCRARQAAGRAVRPGSLDGRARLLLPRSWCLVHGLSAGPGGQGSFVAIG